MNQMEIKTIKLTNVLLGECILEGDELQHLQTRMNEIAIENGATISEGVLTSMLSYDVVGDRQIVKMLMGFMLDRDVTDPKEFEFHKEYILENMICYEFEGNPKEIDDVVNNITQIIQKNNSYIKLSGRVYNQIKSWPKDSEMMSCNIYLGVQSD